MKDNTPRAMDDCHELLRWPIPRLEKLPRSCRFTLGERLERLLRIFLRVCDAVAFAHDRGVLHRDLKPSNVMVGAFGQAYVMDWGLARILGAETDRPDEVVSRDEIWEHVYDFNSDCQSNVVDVYIGYLRKKLEAHGEARGRRAGPLYAGRGGDSAVRRGTGTASRLPCR